MNDDTAHAWRQVLRNSGRPRENQVRAWDSAEAVTLAAVNPEPDDIDVIVLSHARFVRLAREACAAEGLTFRELWRCSLDDDFPSLRARKLWLAIGGLSCLPDE